MRRITSLFCLNSSRRPARALIAALSVTLLASAASAWTVSSRELVDLEFASDQSLRILVSAPGAAAPGLYRWRTDAAKPTLLCHISGPTTFSFDRTQVIERISGDASMVRIYNPFNCRKLATIRVDGRALDTDARGRHLAVAVRLSDGKHELRLYSRRGRLIARTSVGRNVEMGFAPDGRSLVNFDLSDRGAAIWRVPSLAPVAPPVWLGDAENTFVPGSSFVKRYGDDTLSVLRWPSGKVIHAVPASRSVRLRELSASGRYGALHERRDVGESLDWMDFATRRRVALTTGSIDHATINAAGNAVAWSLRDADDNNQVHIQRASIPGADGPPVVNN